MYTPPDDALPVLGPEPAGDCSVPTKCIWKCDAACFHPAPNERTASPTFDAILSRRLGRRALLKRAPAATVPLVLAATPAAGLLGEAVTTSRASAAGHAGLGFAPISLNIRDAVTVPPGYRAQVLLRWGDPIAPGVERMTIDNASKPLQEATFGYNCDLNAYFPLAPGAAGSRSGVLCVNHEYTEGPRMLADYVEGSPTEAQVDVELAAHGMTVVELRKRGRDWRVVLDSPLNRRITAETPMQITGPLRGDPRLRTSADPSGTTVLGMLNNCAGGKTPWGTVLTAEENFHQYFAHNDAVADPAQRALNARYGVPGGASRRRWEQHHDRFDVAAEPHEVNRFGYIVEIDPYDPTFVPRKHTALGRMKHEAATVALAADGGVVAYQGDDERFEYLYKFVSDGRYDPADRAANFSLLESGTLYVARFDDDGSGEWIPLVAGQGALAGWSEQDIVLNTRGAADAVGATPMDRPEDVERNPATGRVYVALTNNTRRTEAQVDAANPRAENRFGHVLEIAEDGGDATAATFRWELFLLCGDPADPSTYFAGYDPAEVSPIACPDNVAFDGVGNLWIATDGQPGTLRRNDTLFAVPTEGTERGHVQAFLSAPRGAEVCGPEFTPDFRNLFVNVQHPGEDSAGPDDAQSLWPDGVWPPLPSLVVVTNETGGVIGS